MSTRPAASPSQEKQIYLEHTAVMVDEAMSYLLSDLSGIYVDCTLGAGGHAMAMLQRVDFQGKLIGIDRDERAIANFRRQPEHWLSRITLFQSPFSHLAELLGSLAVHHVDGVLFDLGMASFQIDEPKRGFSYLHDGPLDMRMDSNQKITARMVINRYGEDALARVLRNYGEEPRWRKIVRAILRARENQPIETTQQLASTIRRIVPGPQAVKVLARVFQGIRLEVNGEVEELRTGLRAAVDLLKPGGRLVVLCYQSLEDRVVKDTFTLCSGVCRCPRDLPRCVCGAEKILKVITKKAVRPSAREVKHNSRARSARLRAAEKISNRERDAKII